MATCSGHTSGVAENSGLLLPTAEQESRGRMNYRTINGEEHVQDSEGNWIPTSQTTLPSKNLREKISKMANGTERICQPKRIGDIIPSLSSKLGGDA